MSLSYPVRQHSTCMSLFDWECYVGSHGPWTSMNNVTQDLRRNMGQAWPKRGTWSKDMWPLWLRKYRLCLKLLAEWLHLHQSIGPLPNWEIAPWLMLVASPQRGTVYSGESTDVQVSDGEWVFGEPRLLPHLTCHLQVDQEKHRCVWVHPLQRKTPRSGLLNVARVGDKQNFNHV